MLCGECWRLRNGAEKRQKTHRSANLFRLRCAYSRTAVHFYLHCGAIFSRVLLKFVPVLMREKRHCGHGRPTGRPSLLCGVGGKLSSSSLMCGSAYPLLGVEACGQVAELEVEDVVAVVVASDGAEALLGGDFGSLGDGYVLQSAIDADVLAVADHDDVLASVLEDAGDGAVEHGPGLGALLSADVDALVVEGDVAQAWDGVGAVVADDAVRACDGHGQTTSVLGETVGEAAVGGVFFEPRGGGGFAGGAGFARFARLARCAGFSCAA